MSELKRTKLTVFKERAVLVAVQLPNSTADPRDPLGELASLTKTAGAKVVASIIQKRRQVDAGLYIGSGKAEEIAELCKQNKANVVIFDNDLSPAQIGGLEKIINEIVGDAIRGGVKVLDRSELILDIFASRAQTYEARLQVELAQMQYTYPRLTKMWSHLERINAGAIGIGARGPGETQLETDRRLVRDRISDLKEEIVHVQERRSREVAKRNASNFTICIVGYTNAGKSTLFNTLTAANTYADDKLFATLDTKTRSWKIDRGISAMLSDTVGFVRDLPHNLVASFKATLEEAVHADLLLHVMDVGHPHAKQQYDSVHIVLKEIGAENKPELLLLNKIDSENGEKEYPAWQTLHPDAIPISAKTGAGLDRLMTLVASKITGQQIRVHLAIPMRQGKLISQVESNGTVHGRDFEEHHAVLDITLGEKYLTDLVNAGKVEVRKRVEE